MTDATPKQGRPRSEASRDAILAATFTALCERGYGELAIESIARAAGVGKATIYRWWPSKASLAVESFFRHTESDLQFPDLGSAQADFEEQVQQVGALLRSSAGQALLAMAVAARTDPELSGAFLTQWILPRRQWGIARLRRAVTDGECDPELPIEIALDLLYGALYWRALSGLGPPDASWIRAAVGQLFEGFRRRPAE